MKTRITLTILVIAAALLATATVHASPREDFYMEKVCPSLTAPYDSACDIVTAAPFTQLVGGQLIYTDRVNWTNPAGHYFEIARVEITTGDGSGSALGQVRWMGDSGLITIMQGTGSLAGLHANVKVEFKGVAEDGRGLYSVTGTYHIDP